MAPSHGMLSHLRFHRASPTSPAPELPSPSTLHAQSSPLSPDVASSSADGPASLAGTSSLPPVLPPISRVTSTDMDLESIINNEKLDAKPLSDGRASQLARASYNGGSGFIGGVAWLKYRRDGGAQQAAGRDSLEDDSRTQGSKPILIQTDLPTRSALAPAPMPHRLKDAKSMTSFSTSYYSHNSSTTSHRPPSSRLGSEPLPPLTVITSNEPPKGKKGLPFLKNPMSTLLLRRKANQSGRNKLPISLDSSAEEPSYDPRIKGTRVHDFSAPRRQSNVPTISLPPSTALPAALSASSGHLLPPQKGDIFKTPQEKQQRHLSNVSDSHRLQTSSALSHGLQEPARADYAAEPATSTGEDELPPRVPPKDNAPSSVQTTPLKLSGLQAQDAETTPKLLGSSQAARSRTVSLSTIPKHMKSTSSRFSFDMMGAAKEEKILEERHRQRELDKKAAVGNAPRASMYDEYDEDDFDYDAMMDDDGLEERIPGVNADYDDDQFADDGNFDDGNFDDDADPDNDQENFAGFVFQRSNPGSSMQRSRATTSSVRTVENGYDESTGQDQSHAMPPESQGFYLTPEMPEIRVNASDPLYDGQTTNSVQQDAVPRDFRDDDLYFGSDVTGFEEEFAEDLAAAPGGDGVPFDESIFDDDDTDQFGRPLPGAFAMAQSLRRLANQDLANHASSKTSGLSTQPSLSSSTAPAHASSFGVDSPQPSQEAIIDQKEAEGVKEEEETKRGQEEDEKEDSQTSSHQTGLVAPVPTALDGDAVAAYQAALAAAAHKAAASGKFERNSSPRQDEADDQVDHNYAEGYYDDAYEDYGYVDDGLDDYELDDDAIIAEANASALANDTDGWYGQEFGFYSAPLIHASQNANKESFGYANGGFFGPKGMSGLGRSESGRIVSREPNLTPITERSEYSNRNSLMSLIMPNVNSGTPTFQGPGLAQLQMMADRGDDMTLSALLRLRSRAFGGSSVSLASSKDGSPRSEWGDASSPRTGTFAGHFAGPNGAHGRKNSMFSIVGRDSDGGSGSESPILKLAIPSIPNLSSMETGVVNADTHLNSTEASSMHFVPSGTRDAPLVAVSTGDGREAPASSVSRSSSNSIGLAPDGSSPIVSYALTGHQRRKDSADSISYRQERDSGDTRWVMERRRTGEFGQVEVVEREIVEGGRI